MNLRVRQLDSRELKVGLYKQCTSEEIGELFDRARDIDISLDLDSSSVRLTRVGESTSVSICPSWSRGKSILKLVHNTRTCSIKLITHTETIRLKEFGLKLH